MRTLLAVLLAAGVLLGAAHASDELIQARGLELAATENAHQAEASPKIQGSQKHPSGAWQSWVVFLVRVGGAFVALGTPLFYFLGLGYLFLTQKTPKGVFLISAAFVPIFLGICLFKEFGSLYLIFFGLPYLMILVDSLAIHTGKNLGKIFFGLALGHSSLMLVILVAFNLLKVHKQFELSPASEVILGGFFFVRVLSFLLGVLGLLAWFYTKKGNSAYSLAYRMGQALVLCLIWVCVLFYLL